jgi:hypothetical protein
MKTKEHPGWWWKMGAEISLCPAAYIRPRALTKQYHGQDGASKSKEHPGQV